MSIRSTLQILLAFLAAGAAEWFNPWLLDTLGLGEFRFVGQIALAIVVLSLLEAAYRRLPESEEPPAH